MTDERVMRALVRQGVFAGMHGLEGFLNASEFWQEQPYGTRLYYGDGGLDYLHRGVLEAAIDIIRKTEPDPTPVDIWTTG